MPSRPVLVALDLPVLPGEPAERGGLWVAAFAAPWTGPLTLYAGPDRASAVPAAELEQPASMGRLNADLPAGFEGRWDRVSVLSLTLLDGVLESVDPLSALSGVNQIAVEGEDGWEVVGFANAQMTGPSQWQVRDLIRGLGGSPVTGASAGARVVVLDGAGATLPLDANALDAPLTLLAVPPGRTLDDVSVREIETVYAGEAWRPLSPVHVRAAWQAEGLSLSWIRRTRIEGDAWSAGDVPLAEAEERYQVEITDAEGVPVWTAETPVPAVLVAMAVAGALPGGARWSVAQISARTGPGRRAGGAVAALL